MDTDPATSPSSADGESPARSRGTDRIVARVVHTKGRLDASSVGHVQRRFVQADLANQAMILAALALSLLLPVLVTLAAVLPLGASGSLPATVGRRLGLSAGSIADLQRLFPTRDAVRGGSTVFGGIFTLVSAYAWPTALQRGYEIAWGVESKGWRGLWRPLAWLIVFVAFVAGLLVLPRSGIADPWRTILLLVIWTPVVFGWTWWTQHFLLRGAVRWRLLVPGAAAMTVGLIGLRAFAAVYLSTAISSNYAQYGPLGIVFMLLTWLIALSVVMLGGAVLGAALHEHPRTRPAAGAPPQASGTGAPPAVPAPRMQDAELLADQADGA
jgi:membrane protein